MAVGLDNSGAHTSPHGTWPDGIEPIPLPAYSPARHPGERGFQEWREPRSNRGHAYLEAWETALTQALRPYGQPPRSLVQRTAYPWWREGVQHITTSAQ
jgi:hypothetical protein